MPASSVLTLAGSDWSRALRMCRVVRTIATSSRPATISAGVRLPDCDSIFSFSPDRLVRPMAAPTISMQIIMPNAIASRAETLILSASFSSGTFILLNMGSS